MRKRYFKIYGKSSPDTLIRVLKWMNFGHYVRIERQGTGVGDLTSKIQRCVISKIKHDVTFKVCRLKLHKPWEIYKMLVEMLSARVSGNFIIKLQQTSLCNLCPSYSFKDIDMRLLSLYPGRRYLCYFLPKSYSYLPRKSLQKLIDGYFCPMTRSSRCYDCGGPVKSNFDIIAFPETLILSIRGFDKVYYHSWIWLFLQIFL